MAVVKGSRIKARSRGSEKKNKELSEIQRLKAENLQLKRQLTRIRKQLARDQADRFDSIDNALEAQIREDEALRELRKQQKLIEHWRCFKCKEDYLRLIIIQRPDGGFYFRKCPGCENRTRLKPLNDKVEGPPSDGLQINLTKIK